MCEWNLMDSKKNPNFNLVIRRSLLLLIFVQFCLRACNLIISSNRFGSH